MTRNDGSDSGLGERIRRGIRDLWEFAHEFHQGYSQVGRMGPRRDERVGSEGSPGGEPDPASVVDDESNEERR